MVAEVFPHALKLVLVDEGGCDDDPNDHGGRTAHGIIQREFDGWLARHGKPSRDVWTITPAEYTEIYHDRYWMPWCDRLPAGMDYAFFDACVNAGPAQAARTLQSVLGLRIDGHMGDVTLGLVAQAYQNGGIEDLIHNFCEARRTFYHHLKQFPRYGRGWLARVDHVERGAKAMTVIPAHEVQRAGLDDETKAQASARANHEDTIEPTVSTEAAATVATSGGMLALLASTLGNLKTELAGFATVHGMETILLVVTIAAVGFGFYAEMHKRRVKEATAT